MSLDPLAFNMAYGLLGVMVAILFAHDLFSDYLEQQRQNRQKKTGTE